MKLNASGILLVTVIIKNLVVSSLNLLPEDKSSCKLFYQKKK